MKRFSCLTLLLLCALPGVSAAAGTCAALWSSGLQNTSDEGEIEFKDEGRLIGDPDGLLETAKVKNKGQQPSCGSTDCAATGDPAAAPAVPDFQEGDSDIEIKVEEDQVYRLGRDGASDYDEVKIGERARVDFDSAFDAYHIRKLKLKKGAVLTLRAGVDYWIEELRLKEGARVQVEGPGTARLYVGDEFKLDEDVLVNSPARGSAGDPQRLFILAYGEVELKETATVSAFLHGGDKVELDEQVHWFGAISAHDEIEVKGTVHYDAAWLDALDVPGICAGGDTSPPVGADAFNCVQPGQDVLSGRLFTRLVGDDFTLDVIALRDSDGDGVADAVAADYADDAERGVTLELVDASAGAACADLPLIDGSEQRLVFRGGDRGRVRSAALRLDRAWRAVRCRVRDDSGNAPVVACSTDRFAIRPAAFTLDSPALDNAGSSGAPIAVAGDAFALAVTAGPGYDGTPALSAQPLEAHPGAVATGRLRGGFTAADGANGRAVGNDFRYDEVGAFRFLDGAIRDSAFAAVDAPDDCIVGSSDTRPDASGRIGCDIANVGASAWIGRFVPASLAVSVNDSGRLANACGAFSYLGQTLNYALPPSLRIEARNRDGGITRNYTGDHLKLQARGLVFVDPLADASASGNDGAALALSTRAGTPVLVDNGDGSLTVSLVGDRFTYAHDARSVVEPFTSDVRRIVQSVTDSDGVTSGRIDLAIAPRGVVLRYGRLVLDNAAGSELQTLAVPLRVEYYAGSGRGFVPGSDDGCSAPSGFALTDGDPDDELSPGDTCVWDETGLSGTLACADPGQAEWRLRTTPVQGDFNLHLAAPGKAGVLSLRVDAPAWLEHDWRGTGTGDPEASIGFGIRSSVSDIIYLRRE